MFRLINCFGKLQWISEIKISLSTNTRDIVLAHFIFTQTAFFCSFDCLFGFSKIITCSRYQLCNRSAWSALGIIVWHFDLHLLTHCYQFLSPLGSNQQTNQSISLHFPASFGKHIRILGRNIYSGLAYQ